MIVPLLKTAAGVLGNALKPTATRLALNGLSDLARRIESRNNRKSRTGAAGALAGVSPAELRLAIQFLRGNQAARNALKRLASDLHLSRNAVGRLAQTADTVEQLLGETGHEPDLTHPANVPPAGIVVPTSTTDGTPLTADGLASSIMELHPKKREAVRKALNDQHARLASGKPRK